MGYAKSGRQYAGKYGPLDERILDAIDKGLTTRAAMTLYIGADEEFVKTLPPHRPLWRHIDVRLRFLKSPKNLIEHKDCHWQRKQKDEDGEGEDTP